MTPPPGEQLLRFVGDRVCFRLRPPDGAADPQTWRARLRTNVGRGRQLRAEIIAAHWRLPASGRSLSAGARSARLLHAAALAPLASWRDVPMRWEEGEWRVELALTEVGHFAAKAYAIDPCGWQVWPEGPDVGLNVHPNAARTANTIYCAFARLFGPTKTARVTLDEDRETRLRALDKQGYTVIPPSGTLRDLKRELPHILDTLGCRIVHLLPVNPTPTTGVRLGRFGSPYAALDLTAIDPALIEFDKRTTGVEQFCELADAVHARGGRLLLDLVVNHTGWHSTLFERHPEWFTRDERGQFVCPGAWGVTWEDLVELDFDDPALAEELAEVFLTWCRRGVDGFRCDAGYKVPLPVWRYITARVREQFPDTIFLLEGLGGAWGDTETLLTEGGMQWAYSELFQEYTGLQVGGYLDHALKQSGRVGVLVHYSETHDNDRLAKRSRAWSLLRNRLCALTSVNGAFGFTCGVEWLAEEKIDVHGSRGLAWGSQPNLLPELATLNQLLATHPCFFDGARLTRLSPVDSPVYALRRDSANGLDRVLVLVNTDPDHGHALALEEAALGTSPNEEQTPPPVNPAPPPRADFSLPGTWTDLLGQPLPVIEVSSDGRIIFRLEPAAAYCLTPGARAAQPAQSERADSAAREAGPSEPCRGLSGDAYRRARAQAAWAVQALSYALPPEGIPDYPWTELARLVEDSPAAFLAAVAELKDALRQTTGSLPEALAAGDPIAAWIAAARAPGPEPINLKDQASPSALSPSLLGSYPRVIEWQAADRRRVTLVAPEHWLLVRHPRPFRARLVLWADPHARQEPRAAPQAAPAEASLPSSLTAWSSPRELFVESIPVRDGHVACFAPPPVSGGAWDAELELNDFQGRDAALTAALRFLAPEPVVASAGLPRDPANALVLLTNGRGAMARLRVDLGHVQSKYDCALGANLHPAVPVDRHVFAKRLRVWINADGFISPLNARNLVGFAAGPPAEWRFKAGAGEGRVVGVRLQADLIAGKNVTVFRFERWTEAAWTEPLLPADRDVRLTVRVDIEDRNFHTETHRNSGAEHHFTTHVRTIEEARPTRDSGEKPAARSPQPEGQGPTPADSTRQSSPFTPHPSPLTPHPSSLPSDAGGVAPVGFLFAPAPDRQLWVFTDAGVYHPAPEWAEGVPHPFEQGRGQVGHGDAYSPGWFDLPLPPDGAATLTLSAEPDELAADETARWWQQRAESDEQLLRRAGLAETDVFGRELLKAMRAFLVRRGSGKTVIAGYPWFLDWGRDTLIAARGLIAAGWLEEVKDLLVTFARFEQHGTLPNAIHGEDASNRDTSDAPLWFALACEELAEKVAAAPASSASGAGIEAFYATPVDPSGRPLADVLRSIAVHYLRGTPNGIRVDPASGLVWSPSHFTWMDTNFPACTPREGYPVEIQALWVRLLRQLDRLGVPPDGEAWTQLAARAQDALQRFFWLPDEGYFADGLLASAGQPASGAVPDRALRSNFLFLVSLGLVDGERARRCVQAAWRHLVVPGALRSLAPLPVEPPLPIHGADGQLLNNPREPYWGRYEGDEDTRRKPAYHNGTAWVWTFPTFCEALARAWDLAPAAVAAARACLGSLDRLLAEGCLGQLPEIVDGDAPHTQRGCDAQAWSVTEALRVWRLLNNS